MGFSWGWAQNDTLNVKPADKAKKHFFKWNPQGVQVGLDLVPWVRNFTNPELDQYELSIFWLNPPYFFVLEPGYMRRSLSGADYDYESSGLYLRLGFDYNLWEANRSGVGAVWALGLRYGFSSFQQDLVFTPPSNYFVNGGGRIEQNNLSAHWLTVQTRMMAPISKRFFIGPSIKANILLSYSQPSEFEVNTIPGFGTRRGLSLQIGYLMIYEFSF